jgi:HK97 family phage major capsid protein/HK97 family phage prohead protease
MTMKRDLEGQTLLRDFSEVLETRNLNEEDRTIEFPFSSETPVNRGYLGEEILDHRDGSIDFSRLNAAAPLLFNHNPDTVLGVVERGWLDKGKKRGMAKVRFAKNAAGEEAFGLVKEGVYKNVSFGYSVNETEEVDNGSYRVTSFTPAEVSLVSVPADFSVGVSRAKGEDKVDKTVILSQEQPTIVNNERATAPTQAASVAQSPTESLMTDTPDLDQVRSKAAEEAAKSERNRIASISSLGRKHGFEELATRLIDNGTSLEDARTAVLDSIEKKPVETVSPVDLSKREQAEYSISAGIRAALTGDWSSKDAGFVRELSQEVERSGVKRTSEKSFLIPYAALQKRATYVTSGATTGGNLVETELKADDFIESLKNNTLMINMGVGTLPGLVGDVAIPRRSGNSTGYWLSSETTAITQSESTFDQISLSPKNYGVLSKYSRQTLLQATPGIEQLIRTDLQSTVNLGVDLAILNGSGSSGQPTGIMQTSGIGSVAGGTNGAAITLENLIKLEEEVLVDNAGGNNMGYVTNAKVLSALKQLRAGGSAAGNGSFLWNTDLSGIGRGATPGVVNGYRIGVTNQVPSNLTKGSTSGECSAVVFGDFSQALVGFWGNGMELAVSDSDGSDFTKALTSVRAITTLDVAVRQASAFSAILDVTT